MASAQQSSDVVTASNCEGRAFVCIEKHVEQGRTRCDIGERGVLVATTSGRPNYYNTYIWRNSKYVQESVDIKNLKVDALATAENTLNRPFRCFSTRTNSEGSLTVSAREEGFIQEYDPATRRAYVQLPRHKKWGWCRLANLHVNRECKWGELTIDCGLPRLTVETIDEKPFKGKEPFLVFLLCNIWEAIMTHRAQLTWLKYWVTTGLPDRPAALTISRIIAQGAKLAGTLDFFAPGCPHSAYNIARKGIRISKNTGGHGIYIIVYRNWKKGTEMYGKKPRVYIGKTIRNFGERWSEHLDSLKNPKFDDAGHYKIGRQAEIAEAFVILRMDNATETELGFAEQGMMLILRTYRPEVIDWAPVVQRGGLVPADTDSEDDAAVEVTTAIDAKQAATQLTQLSEGVFAKVNWPNKLDTSGGCNKQTPFEQGTDYREKLLWTMVDYPDRVVYYRTPSKTYSNRRDEDLVYFAKNVHTYPNPKDGKRPKGMVSLLRTTKASPRPAVGTIAYVSVEIWKDGRHPYAWARLPDFGIWTNWAEANQVAVKMKWQEDGKWYQEYTCRYDDSLGPRTGETQRIAPYLNMINLRHYLERKTFDQYPDWVQVWGTATVKQLKFDNFTQVCSVSDPTTPPTTVPFPVRDQAALDKNIKQLGCTYYGSAPGSLSVEKLRSIRGNGKRACDGCLCFRGYKPCVLAKDKTRCTNCESYGRKCSFSRDDVLLRQRTKHGLAQYENWEPRIQEIADPGYEKFTYK